MRTVYKYIVIILIIVLFSFAFTSSHRIQSIDDLSYIVALGIDVGETEKLKITFQFTKPSSSSGENGSTESSSIILNSIEAPSIDAAFNLMNTYSSKEINLSHCKIIIFSEEIAMSGIKEEIFSLANKVQIRPDTNILICTSSASEYISSVKPNLENLVTKFYAIFPDSSEYTGYTVDADLGGFMNKMMSIVSQPVAMLGNIVSSENFSSNSKEAEDKVLDAKSGVENIGVAVFRQDKLVGTLTPLETISHLIVTDKIKSCNISMPDPEDNENLIDLYFEFSSKPNIDISIVNGTPYVKIEVTANATISSIKQLSNTNTEEQIKLTQEFANNYLQKLISHYLYRTSKELKADCASLGNYALKNFKTVQELENYNWLQHYQDAFFKVETDVTVDSGFLLTGI